MLHSFNCCGPSDPHDTRTVQLSVGGEIITPRYLCSSTAEDSLLNGLNLRKDSLCHRGTASEEPG